MSYEQEREELAELLFKKARSESNLARRRFLLQTAAASLDEVAGSPGYMVQRQWCIVKYAARPGA